MLNSMRNIVLLFIRQLFFSTANFDNFFLSTPSSNSLIFISFYNENFTQWNPHFLKACSPKSSSISHLSSLNHLNSIASQIQPLKLHPNFIYLTLSDL